MRLPDWKDLFRKWDREDAEKPDVLFVVTPNLSLEQTLMGAAGILDHCKTEWGAEWSTWDQSVRDSITKHLRATANDGK